MDTIFATATAPFKSGVAVIRISGSEAIKSLEIFTKKILPKTRYASLRKIYNPTNGELIDEALVICFKSPASFTGEDVVELHVHGSRAVIAEILNCLGEIKNLRMAEPGEFSRRAFLNGKMDLTEAEGLADLIDAQTKMQARLAMRQKQGELGRLYEIWREDILSALSNVEAYIDFPDEEIPLDVITQIENKVSKLLNSISKHLDDKRGERMREGLNVVILGPPNAGKSSLLNLLAKRDVAIVSSEAGTTRDIIEVQLDLSGYPVVIADTAGIRENPGKIEAEGIKRALYRAENADLKIIVLEASSFNSELINDSFVNFGEISNENTILIANKIDLVNGKNISEVNGLKPIAASFNNSFGIENILNAIKEFAAENLYSGDDPLITRERHRILLKEAFVSLHNFSLNKEIEFAAEDLRRAAVAIGKITGKIDVEEVLGRIFSSFCIGK